MARILLQTTITYRDDDWHVGRFSHLARLLESDGHDVTARNREPLSDGSDPVLSRLDSSGFDELWLIAVDTGNGLAPADVRGILRFREKGRGVLTARDHQNLGASLLNLGSIGSVNNFSTYNRGRDRRRFRRNSGNNGDYQRIVPLEPVHEVLRSRRSPSGVIEYFPAHPHEGALSVPDDWSYARPIATSQTERSGRTFNLAIAIDNEPAVNGRAIALSTFHQLSDFNLDESDPERLEIYKDYLRNIARWLSPERI